MMNKNFMVLAVMLAAFIVFCLVLLIWTTGSFSSLTPKPTPTVLNKNGAAPAVPNTTEDQARNQWAFTIGQLISKTPYLGKNFALYYNLDKDTFTLYLNPSKTAQAHAEFGAFLKQNGIGSESFITNMTTSYNYAGH